MSELRSIIPNDKIMTIELRQNLKSFIGARGGSWVDLPSLLSANTLLELAGESLRPRLYFTNSPNGEELCLRADLTISAALYFLAQGAFDKEHTILCEGKVFRAPNVDGAPAEFTQIGIEKFGGTNPILDDIETFLSVFGACKNAGLGHSFIRLTDGNLIDKIIAKAELPNVWRNYLRARAKSIKWLKSGIEAAMRHEKSALNPLEEKLLRVDDKASEALILELIETSRFQTGPARTVNDITKRIKSKAELKASLPLNNEIGSLLLDVLQLQGDPQNVLSDISFKAKSIRIDLQDWIKAWEDRIKSIQGEICSNTIVQFEAANAARFEYYDGMIFEIAPTENPELAIAFGGRYDGLINALSNGEHNICAVGAVIRPERLLGALGV